MPDKKSEFKRRDFLYKSTVFFIGGLLGFKFCTPAFASLCQNKNPRIAIIIDDIGFSKSRLDSFININAPLTFSILPQLPMSSVLAEKIHNQGYEVMLHQPMEPLDPNIDPGPGAVYVKDSPDKIESIIKQNISETPFVVGINNHMGSRFTACGKEMKEALSVIKNRGLFFVDSLTTNRSTAYLTAKTMNISTIRRNIFIDNVHDEDMILMQLKRLKKRAITHGYAIGIGHPLPETARAFNSFYQHIKNTNISLVSISNLLS